MSQNNELDAVKRRIRALVEKTVNNGATEHEANIAFEKVGQLLEQYNLSMNEVLVSQQEMKRADVDLGSKTATPISSAFVAISHFTDTKCWYTGGSRHKYGRAHSNKRIVFYGLEQDVEMAEYLANIVMEASKTEFSKYKQSEEYQNYQGHRRVLHTGFLGGFDSRISTRLRELKAKLQKERAEAAEATASEMEDRLVEATNGAYKASGVELVVLAKKTRIEEGLKKMGMKFSHSYYNRSYGDYQARGAGSNAANNVNLSRPVGNGGRKTVGLLG